jgi:hypothetical protein
MRVSKLRFSLGIAALVVVLFATPARSYADTYQIFNLGSDQGYFFYGMDDSGDVVLDYPNGGPACNNSTCYYTFLNGTSTGFSGTVPSLTPDNGTPCAPSLPSGGSVLHGVCNNGRVAFTGFLTTAQVMPGVFTGTNADPAAYTLGPAQNGDGFIFMNSQGDVVYDDVFAEDWFEAVDLTTETPEPNSIFLLGTGALAVAATMRRRIWNLS